MASTLPQLLKAIQGGSVQEVKRVLTYNPSLAHQKQARDGHTPLHVAAATGNLAIVRELLQAGARCQETDSNLEVPLHIACFQRNGAGVVKELLSDAGRRSCLRAMNREGATPLHLAVQAGLMDVAQLLVNAGAKVDASDRTGRTPLDYVDPRLPGLAELLEAGRQLTPSRPGGPKSHHASAAPRHHHRHSPLHSPSGHLGPHRAGQAAASAAASAAGSTVASPVGGGRQQGRGTGVASPGGGGQGAGGAWSTPQRRGSSMCSSWDTSPSQAARHNPEVFYTPVQHSFKGPQQLQPDSASPPQHTKGPGALTMETSSIQHKEPSLAPAATAAAAEDGRARLTSPKPPRPRVTEIAAAAAAVQQQQQVVPASAAESPCDALPIQASAVVAEQQQVAADSTPSAAAAAAVHAASPGASDAGQQQQVYQQQQASADLTQGPGPEAGPRQQQLQPCPPTLVSSTSSQEQQQQQVVLQGPLQLQAPTSLPQVPAYTVSSGAGGGGGASGDSYCRGPLSLAQPQMQAVPAGQQATYAGQGGVISSVSQGSGRGAVGLHYQQLAAATVACHQSLQQLHGNLGQLSGQRSSTNIHSSSSGAPGGMAGVPMGPLRSARAAAAAAAAMEPGRVSYDRLTGVACAPGAAGAASAGPGGPPVHVSYRGGVGGERRSSSHNGMLVGNSWIVTPEASCGLLGGVMVGGGSAASHNGLAAAPASSSGGAGVELAAGRAVGGAADGAVLGPSVSAEASGASAAGAHTTEQHAGSLPHQAMLETGAPATAAPTVTAAAPGPEHSSHAVVPYGQIPAGVVSKAPLSTHPMLAAAQQRQQLAGIAAAVAAGGGHGGSSGPLQAPLLAQLGEVAGRVCRLEEFMEAQVELIPDWQKALEVVQALKRQADDHGHLLVEQEARLATHTDFSGEVTAKVDGLAGMCQQAQESSCKAQQQLGQLEAAQASLQECVTTFDGRLQQLQEQVAQQETTEGTRAAAGEGQVTSLVSQMEDTNTRLDATAARLSSLESTAAETQQQLLDQRQALAAATALATAVVERGAATDHGSDGSAGSSSSSKGSAVALRASSASNAQQALLTECLTKQLAELKQQFWGLSATVAAMSSARRVASTLARKQGQESQSVKSEDLDAAPCPAAGAVVMHRSGGADDPLECQQEAAGSAGGGGGVPSEVGDSWLPFMESTSACLATHEQQIEALQALVPKLDGVVSQRAQLINVAEQVAALQTAFNMLSHGNRSGSHNGGPTHSPLAALVPPGPLATHKAASDSLSLATSMVRLQGQMGQLTTAVEGLREEWEEAAGSIRGDREAIRRDWEAERARIASAEAEVARLLTEQQAQLADREERLLHIRAAANEADETASIAALESQQHMAQQLASLQAQQAAMAQQLAAAQASNDSLRAELKAVQGQLAATAEAQAAMAEAQAAATAAMAAAAAANLRQSIAEGAAAAAACSQHGSRAPSPAAHKAAGKPAMAAAAGASGSGSSAAADAAPEYPYVRESATPTDAPLLPGAGTAGPAAAALAAAAAAATPASLSAEPSVELEVLGQQKLMTGSIFGPGYWGGPEARCSSSGSADKPQEAATNPAAASGAGTASAAPAAASGTALITAEACVARQDRGPVGSTAAAWVDPRARSPVVSPTADSTAGERAAATAPRTQPNSSAPRVPAADEATAGPVELWPAAAAVQRRRMTYDTGLPASKADRDTSQAAGAAAVERYLAGAAAAAGADGGYVGMTDTYAASAAAAGRLSPAEAAAAAADVKDGNKKKMGWLAKVRLGRSSSSKSKAAAAAGVGSVGDAYTTATAAAAADNSRKLSRTDKAAAAKAKKQRAGARQGLDSATAAPAHKPAGGALFGRWGKQAGKAAGAAGEQARAGAGGVTAPLQDWPSLHGSGCIDTGSAAAGVLGQPPSRDVTGGGDQAAPMCAAGAGSSAGGAAAGIHVLYPTKAAAAGVQQASGKRWRRLLGSSSN